MILQKDELSKIAENIEQEVKELSTKEVLDIFRSDYDSRIQKLQQLAQTILESLLYEKTEVYYHKKAGEEERKNSVQTLNNITARYKFILRSIIKVFLIFLLINNDFFNVKISFKLQIRLRNQAKSDEKAKTYITIYSKNTIINEKLMNCS